MPDVNNLSVQAPVVERHFEYNEATGKIEKTRANVKRGAPKRLPHEKFNKEQLGRMFSQSNYQEQLGKEQDKEQELCIAAAKGDVNQVRTLLDKGVKINVAAHVDSSLIPNKRIDSEDTRGYPVCKAAISDRESTPLYWAAYYDRPDVVKLLLERGAKNTSHKVKLLFEDGTENILDMTPFEVACYGYYKDVIKYFINKDKKYNGNNMLFGSSQNIFCLLNKAIRHADVDFVKWLLNNNVIIDTDFYGEDKKQEYCSLYIALSSKQPFEKKVALIEFLLSYAKQLDVKKNQSQIRQLNVDRLMNVECLDHEEKTVYAQWTLLHFFAWNPSGSDTEKTKLLQWFLENATKFGLNVHPCFPGLKTPIHLAVETGHIEAVQLFANYCTDKEWVGVEQCDNAEIARGLLSTKIDKQQELVELALKGKDLNALNSILVVLLGFVKLNNLNAFELNEQTISAIKILVERGASAHQKMGIGQTLYGVAKNSYPEFAGWLLEKASVVDDNKAGRIQRYLIDLRGRIQKKDDWKVRRPGKTNPEGIDFILKEIDAAEKEPNTKNWYKALHKVDEICAERGNYNFFKKHFFGQDESTQSWYKEEKKNYIDPDLELSTAAKKYQY